MTASAGPVLEALHEEYGTLVDFLTLYVRETHPGDRCPQPQSYEEKVQHAREFRERDGITWPVLVDDLEGSYHRLLDAKPNSVFLVDRDGRVAYRQLWAGDRGPLRRALEKVLAGATEPLGQNESRLIPLMRGVGMMDQTLRSAGPAARDNMRRAAPPLFGMALLAGLFRPLPPLGRALAASGLALGALTLLGVAGASIARNARARRSHRSHGLRKVLHAGAPLLAASRGLQKKGRRALRNGREALRHLRELPSSR